MAKINLVGEIPVCTISFMPPPIEESRTDVRGDGQYLYERSAEHDGYYDSYIYYTEDDKFLCYDMFKQWRYTMNDGSYFRDNEFLIIKR